MERKFTLNEPCDREISEMREILENNRLEQ